MATTGDRLAEISGLSGVSAATMLLAIGSGGTAGALLVDYSGLPSGTAMDHLLTDSGTPAVVVEWIVRARRRDRR